MNIDIVTRISGSHIVVHHINFSSSSVYSRFEGQELMIALRMRNNLDQLAIVLARYL